MLLNWDDKGVVSHAGLALLRQLADKTGLTGGLSGALACSRLLIHDRGRVMADLACAIPDGGEVISDFRVLADQKELFSPVASVPTGWRALSEVAQGGPRALERISAAVTDARRRVWAAGAARHGGLPGVRIADKVLEGLTRPTWHSYVPGAAIRPLTGQSAPSASTTGSPVTTVRSWRCQRSTRPLTSSISGVGSGQTTRDTAVSFTARLLIIASPTANNTTVTKSALNMLTPVSRKELEADGIRVSLVLPSIMATEFGGRYQRGHQVRPGVIAHRPGRTSQATILISAG